MGCVAELATLSSVKMVENGVYGKAVFIVSPRSIRSDCLVKVNAANGQKDLDCNSDYLIACDVERPTGTPFCALLTEVGANRSSAYPREAVR